MHFWDSTAPSPFMLASVSSMSMSGYTRIQHGLVATTWTYRACWCVRLSRRADSVVILNCLLQATLRLLNNTKVSSTTRRHPVTHKLGDCGSPQKESSKLRKHLRPWHGRYLVIKMIWTSQQQRFTSMRKGLFKFTNHEFVPVCLNYVLDFTGMEETGRVQDMYPSGWLDSYQR